MSFWFVADSTCDLIVQVVETTIPTLPPDLIKHKCCSVDRATSYVVAQEYGIADNIVFQEVARAHANQFCFSRTIGGFSFCRVEVPYTTPFQGTWQHKFP